MSSKRIDISLEHKKYILEDNYKAHLLKAAPCDVLLSNEAFPYPGAILKGFRESSEFEPYLAFYELQKLLEFLEYVVLCERLIVPIPRYSKETGRIVNDEEMWTSFALFQAAGDLDFTTEKLGDRLNRAGVVVRAEIQVGDPTSDAVITRLMTSSPWLQLRFAKYLQISVQDKDYDKFQLAQAYMSTRLV